MNRVFEKHRLITISRKTRSRNDPNLDPRWILAGDTLLKLLNFNWALLVWLCSRAAADLCEPGVKLMNHSWFKWCSSSATGRKHRTRAIIAVISTMGEDRFFLFLPFTFRILPFFFSSIDSIRAGFLGRRSSLIHPCKGSGHRARINVVTPGSQELRDSNWPRKATRARKPTIIFARRNFGIIPRRTTRVTRDIIL